MHSHSTLEKLAQVKAGHTAIMSNAELDWLIEQDQHPLDMVSLPNPAQLGLLDAYMVALKSHPVVQAARAERELTTSAKQTLAEQQTSVWDEPAEASTPRGWYWPKGTTTPGRTTCAGHYLDYGPTHWRCDDRQALEPGHIHCVVLSALTGRAYASRYVETVEQARAWLEQEAVKAGHRLA